MIEYTRYRIICAGFLCCFISLNTHADIFELNGGGGAFSQAGDGTSTGRGIAFLANDDFSINSVGIFADLMQESYDVVIYSSVDGHQVTGTLALASAVVGGSGSGWNDININFSFDSGSYYAINWRPTDGNANDWANTILYYPDAFLPNEVGPVTLIDGFANFAATGFDNTLHPSLRINTSVVPVPAAFWLFGSGLIGLLGVARRKTR